MSTSRCDPIRPHDYNYKVSHEDHGSGGGREGRVFREILGATQEVPVDDNADFEDLREFPEEQGEIIELDEDEDCAPRIVAPDPGAPTDEEREDHRVDHYPYRCWCEHCVMGRGTGEQHRVGPGGAIPTITFDYLLVTKTGIHEKGKEMAEAAILPKILVAKEP